jgi:small subunit ribosomal protein S3
VALFLVCEQARIWNFNCRRQKDPCSVDDEARLPGCVQNSDQAHERTIVTSRPGLVIGKKGAEIDILKAELKKLTGKEVWIEVEEIKRPDLDAKLVADAIAKQLERRIPFRRVLKKAMQTSMDAGAAGIKVQISGRIGGAEIARVEWYKEGRIPLHTIKADIDYAHGRAETTYGSIGVKVWINKGEEIIAPIKQAVGS